MASVQPSYEELQQKVEELTGLLGAIRAGEVDTLALETDPNQLLVVRDYADQLQRDRQLAKLQAIVETVPTALAIVWPGGEIHLANGAFLDVSGSMLRDTLQDWAAGLRAGSQLAADLDRRLAQALESPDRPFLLEVEFAAPDGRKLCWVLSIQRLPGRIEGRPAAMVAGIDVTAQKLLIVELSDAKCHMESFLAAAAHDLKAPLITIAHNAAFARMSVEEDPSEVVRYLDRIQSAEKSMVNLLSQLSEVSRAGFATEPRGLHSFNDLVQAALAQVEGVLVERGAQVSVAEDLPKLRCQRNKIIQVFVNLISNAAKYAPRERTPQIQVGHLRRPDLGDVFFVRDNGVGISEEHLLRVFEPFCRLAPDLDVPGQGLGLNIVDRTVAQHGGQVWAESTPGEGSTFLFSLPQR